MAKKKLAADIQICSHKVEVLFSEKDQASLDWVSRVCNKIYNKCVEHCDDLMVELRTISLWEGIDNHPLMTKEITVKKKDKNNKMARKKANSKAFKRACDHQVNYINWSIKQLNLGQYNEIRLESNKNIKRGKRTSKSLRHWSWSKINKAITLQAEERNVSVQLQRSPYKSQRCNSCGWVQKKNRSGKLFRCQQCHHVADADMNSARNNAIDLCVVPTSFRNTKPNIRGFYWLPTGIHEPGESGIGAEIKLHSPAYPKKQT